ncbi:MAG: hypothetical protein NUV98_06665 [Candidatus Roizmanbacteria bacterium]|nr:hypothetical protein [Candidatus Roizmanbacteria bacterium]
MHLYIFTSPADYSIKLIEQELVRRGVSVEKNYFKNVTVVGNTIVVRNKKLAVLPSDRILIRNAWNSPFFTRDYTILAREIIKTYSGQVVFDTHVHQEHIPFFLDKLYQAFLYQRISLKTPRVWYFSHERHIEWDKLLFPCVLKKRISSRSRANFLIQNKQELIDQLALVKLHEYLIQEYIDAKRDVRLNVLRGKVLYAFERTMRIHEEDHRLYVKGGRPLARVPKTLEKMALAVVHATGTDFAGVDFLQGKDGLYYLIETNLSPQFNRAQDIMPVKTAELVVDEILK